MIERPSVNIGGRQRPKRIIAHAMAEQIELDQGTIDYYRERGKAIGRPGEMVYAATWLERIGLSAHKLVASGGEVILCVDDHRVAWHAKGFNGNSLGMEILVPGVYDYGSFLQRIEEPWCAPDSDQYKAAVGEVATWCRAWGIRTGPGELDRHSDVSPGRKFDPGGGFPWDQFVDDVVARLGEHRA